MSTSKRQGQYKHIRATQKEPPTEDRREGRPQPPNRRNTPYEGTFPSVPNRLYTSPGLERVLDERVSPQNRRRLDRYRWLVSSIVFVGAMNKQHAVCEDGYVPLNYNVLRSVLSQRHLTETIQELIAWEVIERRKSYRVGYYSMGYRLNTKFPFGKFRSRIITDRLLHKKLNAHREMMLNGTHVRPGHRAVFRAVEALEIDHAEARRLVLKQFRSGELDSDRKYTSRIIGIESIALRNLFHAIDPKTGRYYHSYACLAKELRPMVRLEGSPLCEVDITNSQPLLLHLLLKERGMVNPIEAEHMESLVLNGMFYEEFNTVGMDRDEFKKEFFRDVLFGKGLYTNATTELFKKKFPSYAAAIRALKKGAHSRLAIAMQTMEAQVIFTAVELFVERFGRDSPIITIHDSLSTTPPYCQAAKETLAEAFMERFGVIPTLKIK